MKTNIKIYFRYKTLACFFIPWLAFVFTSCARYHPAILISYTKEGNEVSIKKLTKGAAPSWSPDGKQIVFQDQGICILDIETKKRIQLTSSGSNPGWSPNGKQVAYVHNGIWIWDDASRVHRLFSHEGDHPCWMPNGEAIAFSRQGIWLMNTDGSNKIKLADTGIPLSFSPDGLSMLIEQWQPDQVLFGLAEINLANSETRRLTDGTKGSYAPDGQSIVYSHEGIWAYSKTKKDSTRIVMDGYDPKWSPAGDRIVFCDRGYIWIIDAPYKATPVKWKFR
ncbi:PD40 domain-containing protein [bacterium]|nr:PD40 domain-containing protein [bacterium]